MDKDGWPTKQRKSKELKQKKRRDEEEPLSRVRFKLKGMWSSSSKRIHLTNAHLTVYTRDAIFAFLLPRSCGRWEADAYMVQTNTRVLRHRKGKQVGADGDVVPFFQDPAVPIYERTSSNGDTQFSSTSQVEPWYTYSIICCLLHHIQVPSSWRDRSYLLRLASYFFNRFLCVYWDVFWLTPPLPLEKQRMKLLSNNDVFYTRVTAHIVHHLQRRRPHASFAFVTRTFWPSIVSFLFESFSFFGFFVLV